MTFDENYIYVYYKCKDCGACLQRAYKLVDTDFDSDQKWIDDKNEVKMEEYTFVCKVEIKASSESDAYEKLRDGLWHMNENPYQTCSNPDNWKLKEVQ